MPDDFSNTLASGFTPSSPARGFPSPQPFKPNMGYLHLDFLPLMVVAGSDELETRELKDVTTSLSGQVKSISWGLTVRVWRCQVMFLRRDELYAAQARAKGSDTNGVVIAGGVMLGGERVPVYATFGPERRGQDAKTFTLELTLTEKLEGEYGEPDLISDEIDERALTG